MVKQLKLINDFYYCQPGKGALSSNTCYSYVKVACLFYGEYRLYLFYNIYYPIEEADKQEKRLSNALHNWLDFNDNVKDLSSWVNDADGMVSQEIPKVKGGEQLRSLNDDQIVIMFNRFSVFIIKFFYSLESTI